MSAPAVNGDPLRNGPQNPFQSPGLTCCALEAQVAEVSEAEVFTSPTAGALIVALLGHKISHVDITVILRRRFPSCKISMLRVRRMAHAMAET